MKKKEYLKPDIEYVGFVYSVIASTSGGAGHGEDESVDPGTYSLGLPGSGSDNSGWTDAFTQNEGFSLE